MAFILLPFVTRVLTPAEYGLISVVVALMTLASSCIAGVVEPIYFRAVVRAEENVVAAGRLYLLWVVPIASLMVAALLCMVAPRGPGVTVWAAAAAAAGISAASGVYGLAHARATDNMQTFLALSLTTIAVGALAKLAFLGWLLPGPLGWVLSDLLTSVVSWVLTVALIRSTTATSISPVLALLRVAWPLMPQRLALWGMVFMNRPLLALFLASSEIGLFSLAVNLAAVATMLLMEINRASHLEFSKEEFPAPTDLTRDAARLTATASLLIPAALAGGVAATAPLFIGQRFSDAIPILGVLLIGQVLYGYHLIPMNYVVLTAGKYRWSSVPSLAGTVFLVIVTVIGGATGSLIVAAAGPLSAYLVALLAARSLVRFERLDVNYARILPSRRVFLAQLASLLVGILSLSVFPHVLAPGLGVAAVVFAGASWMLSKSEWRSRS